MANSHSLDQTSRARLASECHEIRAQLKEWEKEFADANSGRKPGRTDIKQNPDIAAKYKTYNRTRDVLDGKKELDSLKAQSPSVRRHKSASSSTAPQPNQGETQGPAQPFATPRKPRKLHAESHPSLLDPYDAPPATVSPHPYVFRNAIGPTPQRDGTILGLFDILSRSGSTPSSRKRKVDVMDGKTVGMNVAQTPSKRLARGEGDQLDHLADDSGGRRHTRTPASDGKKFLLSQFFATPSTVRFAAIAREDGNDTNGKTEVDRTPLRTKVLGGRSEYPAENENAFDMTPAYLKRTTSFNQRLLTASGSNSQKPKSNSNLIFASPSAVRRGPLKRPFKGRGLSEILRGLRQMEDNDDEDEMDALREMEGNDVNVLVGDSQSLAKPSVAEDVAEEVPAKIWKKKGQKRTTRRVIMRPTTTQPRPRETILEEEDQHVVDSEDVVGVEETQVLTPTNKIHAELGESEDDLHPLPENHEDEEKHNSTNCENNQPVVTEAEAAEEEEDQDAASADSDSDSDSDSLALPPKSKSKPIPRARKQDTTAQPNKKKKPQENKARGKEKGVTNPNALSHMNFRTLKIRNRNSKAGGKGRFGTARR